MIGLEVFLTVGLITEAEQLSAHVDHQHHAIRCFCRLLCFRIPRATRTVEHYPAFLAQHRATARATSRAGHSNFGESSATRES